MGSQHFVRNVLRKANLEYLEERFREQAIDKTVLLLLINCNTGSPEERLFFQLVPLIGERFRLIQAIRFYQNANIDYKTFNENNAQNSFQGLNINGIENSNKGNDPQTEKLEKQISDIVKLYEKKQLNAKITVSDVEKEKNDETTKTAENKLMEPLIPVPRAQVSNANDGDQENVSASRAPTGNQNTIRNDKIKRGLIIGGAAVATGAAAGAAAVVLAPVALAGLGFGAAGIAAGSVAAGIQSMIGSVAAGSLFASLTSAGAAGIAASTSAAIGVAAGGVAAAGAAAAGVGIESAINSSSKGDKDNK